MQDTVKLPAESPIPGGVDRRQNGLCPLRALGTAVQAGICLVSLFMRSNIVIWHRTAPGSSRCCAAASFRRVSYFKRPRPGTRLRSDLSAVLPAPRSSLIKVRPDTREIRLNFAPTTLTNVKFKLFSWVTYRIKFLVHGCINQPFSINETTFLIITGALYTSKSDIYVLIY